MAITATMMGAGAVLALSGQVAAGVGLYIAASVTIAASAVAARSSLDGTANDPPRANPDFTPGSEPPPAGNYMDGAYSFNGRMGLVTVITAPSFAGLFALGSTFFDWPPPWLAVIANLVLIPAFWWGFQALGVGFGALSSIEWDTRTTVRKVVALVLAGYALLVLAGAMWRAGADNSSWQVAVIGLGLPLSVGLSAWLIGKHRGIPS